MASLTFCLKLCISIAYKSSVPRVGEELHCNIVTVYSTREGYLVPLIRTAPVKLSGSSTTHKETETVIDLSRGDSQLFIRRAT